MTLPETAASFDPPQTRLVPVRQDRALSAAADLLDGLFRSWLWTTLAHQDLKLRYRGSILGPFWQTITTAS